MKPDLILISHGDYAYQLYQSAKMVVGEIRGLHTVSMDASDGLDGTKRKLNEVLSQIEEGHGILIAADLFSGTPCNVAVEAMYNNPNVRVITGLNLPMAIEYAVSTVEGVEEMASFLKEVGLESIQVVVKPDLGGGEEGYED